MKPPEESLPLILIVDDQPTNIDILISALRSEYRIAIAKNGIKAIDLARNYHPELILLDIMMPAMNGYEVLRNMKSDERTADIPVIFITAITEAASKTQAFSIGAVDYITKPYNTSEVKARVGAHLSIRRMQQQLSDQNATLQQKVEEKTGEIQKVLSATIRTMAQMAESRDPYTAGHQQRVSQLACAIAKKLQMTEVEIDIIRVAGLLHDIGKFRIPVDILNRPGKLLDVEHQILKIHPRVGYDLLIHIPFTGPVAEIVYQHHERMNGSGYPRMLKGEDILPEARIICVADVVEAMGSHRPYRPALGIAAAMDEIMKKRETYFDPLVVDACGSLLEEGELNGIFR